MKALNPIQNEEFKTRILKDYLRFSEQQEKEVDINLFLDFLIEMNMLPNRNRFRYLILKKCQALKNKGVRKTDAVYQLADEFDVHENTVWNILKYNKNFL